MAEQEIQLTNDGKDESYILPSIQFTQSDSYEVECSLSACESKLLYLEDTSMKNRLDETIVEELGEDCRDDESQESYNEDGNDLIIPSVGREEEGGLIKSDAYDDNEDSRSTEDNSSIYDDGEVSRGPSEFVNEISVTKDSSENNAKLVTGIDFANAEPLLRQVSSHQRDDDEQDNELQEVLVQETESISSDGEKGNYKQDEDSSAADEVAGIDLTNAEEEEQAAVQLDPNDYQDHKLDESLVQETESVSSDCGRDDQGKNEQQQEDSEESASKDGTTSETSALVPTTVDAESAASKDGTTSETNSLVLLSTELIFNEDEEGNFVRFTNQEQNAEIPNNKDMDPKSSSLLRLAMKKIVLGKTSSMDDDTQSTMCESSIASSASSESFKERRVVVDHNYHCEDMLEVEHSLSHYEANRQHVEQYLKELQRKLNDKGVAHWDTFVVEHSLSEHEMKLCVQEVAYHLDPDFVEELSHATDEWCEDDEAYTILSVKTAEQEEFAEFIAEHYPNDIGCVGLVMLDLSEQEKELDELYEDDKEDDTTVPILFSSPTDLSSICEEDDGAVTSCASPDNIPYSKCWFAKRADLIFLNLNKNAEPAVLQGSSSSPYKDDRDYSESVVSASSSGDYEEDENSQASSFCDETTTPELLPYHETPSSPDQPSELSYLIGFAMEGAGLYQMEPMALEA